MQYMFPHQLRHLTDTELIVAFLEFYKTLTPEIVIAFSKEASRRMIYGHSKMARIIFSFETIEVLKLATEPPENQDTIIIWRDTLSHLTDTELANLKPKVSEDQMYLFDAEWVRRFGPLIN